MPTASYRTTTHIEATHPLEKRFFTGMALAMIAIFLLCFIPSITHPGKGALRFQHSLPRTGLCSSRGSSHF